jgi:hypothetical protein
VAPTEDSANPVEARAAKRVATMVVSFMMMMMIVGGISFSEFGNYEIIQVVASSTHFMLFERKMHDDGKYNLRRF